MTTATAIDVVDLFAGPGGWSEALRRLGLSEVALEWDARACATRAAAGHRTTIRTDVAAYPTEPLERAGIRRLIGSPPCPAWSEANRNGKAALDDLDLVLEALHRASTGRPYDDLKARAGDPTSLLVVEPMRYAYALRPRWVALEQVPAALPAWRAFEVRLHRLGYRTWSGVLNAADYGAPQSRERAVLLAHLERHVEPPAPTHAADPTPCLFAELDRRPWRTMAEALGWTEADLERAAYPANERDLAPMPAGLDLLRWPLQRPATAVTSAGRVACPGYRLPGQPQFGEGAYRVTVAEAGVLQGFPRDYPWQGNQGERHKQAGNAVPVELAEAVIRSLED